MRIVNNNAYETVRQATVNSPAERLDHEMIVEGIVTTTNEDGSTNVSPMGPVTGVDFKQLRLRPFNTSTTFKNLRRHPFGVFHITDDVDLLVRSALGLIVNEPAVEPIDSFEGKYLTSSCRWYAFEATDIDESAERVEIQCEVRKQDCLRDFLGWNRAMHAVLEATILATRVSFLPREVMSEELGRLSVAVSKTASQRERHAFALVMAYVDQQLAARS